MFMEEQRAPLRFGIMVDDLSMDAWKVETVKKLIRGGMTCSMIIRNAETVGKKTFFQRLKGYPVRRLFFRVWNHYWFRPESKTVTALGPALDELGVKLEEIPLIDCEPVYENTSTFFVDKDIETIKNQHLDFILRFGFNIIRGTILESAKYGVWSFHHDDEMEYRGGPPGFWEWMQDNPRNGVILQRLTEQLDKGLVLNKRWYPTILHSYRAHLDQLLMDSSEMPLQVCLAIQHTGRLEERQSESKAPLYRAPYNLKMLRYWWLCFARRVRFHWHDVFRQEDWNVGYVEAPLKDFMKDPLAYQSQITWFKRRLRRLYFADPFVITTDKDTYLFFESYDYRTGKGRIEMVRKSKRYRRRSVVLEEPWHLSYPFVFAYEGAVYCLPEGNESGRLGLYRFDEEALKMVPECVLLEQIQVIDPTLVYHEGCWNLFFTQKDYPSVKLYRFTADNLRGPYKPFYGNPVKVDCANARMAGSFIEQDGDLIRPAQECMKYYGTAVCLNRVQQLSESRYREIEIAKIHPFMDSRFKQGLHTLNGNEAITVFDGKRWIFTFSGMFHQLGNKMKRRRTNRYV